MIRLFVDDWKPMPEYYDKVARSVSEAISILASGFVIEISLDHDISLTRTLSNGTIIPAIVDHINQPKEDFTAVVLYIAAMPENLRPKIVRCHSGNQIAYDKYPPILQKAGIKMRPAVEYDVPEGK